MSNAMKYHLEFQAHIRDANSTVSERLYETIIDQWWNCCAKDERIFTLVFWVLMGKQWERSDFKDAHLKVRRALYTFTAPYSFPWNDRVYIAEIVATILLESRIEELIDVYINYLLSLKAQLEHDQLQRERHYRGAGYLRRL